MAHHSNNQVLASANRSAGTGYSTAIPTHSYRFAIAVVYATAKSGSPYLDISLQTSPVDPAIDNSKWRTVYSEDRITATMLATLPAIFGGHVQEDFTGWLRIAYTLGGTSTPKITFSLNIELK